MFLKDKKEFNVILFCYVFKQIIRFLKKTIYLHMYHIHTHDMKILYCSKLHSMRLTLVDEYEGEKNKSKNILTIQQNKFKILKPLK